MVYFFLNKYMLTKPWHLRSVLFEKRKWLFLHDIRIIDIVILTPRYENEQIRRKPKSTRSWLTETWNCLVSIRAEGEEFQQVQNSENIEILKQRKWKNNKKANNSTPLEHDFRNFPGPPSLIELHKLSFFWVFSSLWTYCDSSCTHYHCEFLRSPREIENGQEGEGRAASGFVSQDKACGLITSSYKHSGPTLPAPTGTLFCTCVEVNSENLKGKDWSGRKGCTGSCNNNHNKNQCKQKTLGWRDGEVGSVFCSFFFLL